MKTDRSQQYKEQYFKGASDDAEEKWLKEFSDDVFFKTLREEKEVKMDWSFEDFMDKLENPAPQKFQKAPVRISYTKWYWVAAGLAILLSFGGYLFLNQNTADIKDNIVQHQIAEQSVPAGNDNNTIQPGTETKSPGADSGTPPKVLTEKNNIQEQFVQEKTFAKKNKKTVTVNPPVNSVPETTPEEDYNPNYVLINGKPVHSEEEATDITLKSLNLLASNIDNGVAKIGLIKNLSVNF